MAALLAQAQPLTLDGAVKLALERNPDLMKQNLLTLSAEQDKVVARSAILPSLGFNASYTDTRQGATDALVVAGFKLPGQPTSVFHSWAGSASIRQLVFDGGKWWNNLAASDLAYQSSSASLDEQRLQITYL